MDRAANSTVMITKLSVLRFYAKSGFVGIVLKKSVFERLVVETEEALLSLSACYLRFWDKLGELSEVLCCGCELELFVCAFGSSKSHHGQADVSLQMGK